MKTNSPQFEPSFVDNLFRSKGRLNRLPFFLIYFGAAPINYMLYGLASVLPEVLQAGVMFIAMALNAVILVLAAIRRFHDINYSGWCYLLLMIPVVNMYYFLILLFRKGTPGDNLYGPDPCPPRTHSYF